MYVKDDAELNALLLNAALDEAALYLNPEAPPLRGPGLESLARQYVEVQAIVRRWARRFDERLLDRLLYVPVLVAADFDQPSTLSTWVTQLTESLNQVADGAAHYELSVETASNEGQPVRIHIHKREHGSTTHKTLTRDFFDSADYRRIAELSRTLTDLIGEGAFVQRGEARQAVHSFKEAIDWLFDHAKRGQSIQRYKGLGEMNPDQLWETTINPETRRLMQVKIEDAVAADEIFTTLMGDQVEPRREFIERNALTVANLDV
jgi:DNA gyrase subunit B